MNLNQTQPVRAARRESASVLIIVLWVCIGLISMALYFANSMNYELQAADNRVNGLAAGQAIEGAQRYVGYTLALYATNGAVPDNTQFSCEAVPVGDARFWIIGRDPSVTPSPTEPYFGLIDEGSKLNLNRVGTNTLSYLPNMDPDFAQAIVDWRSTNGGESSLDYAQYGYAEKEAPFETVDELRLVDGATMDLLYGEDLNLNGVLDAGEKDQNANGQLDPGLLEYTTVYSREPNFLLGYSYLVNGYGSPLTNVAVTANTDFNKLHAQLQALFENANVNNSYGLVAPVYKSITNKACASVLDFYLRCQQYGMNSADFAKIYNYVTINPGTNNYITGRLNLNTASADVMTALFMGSGVDEDTAQSAAQTLVTYRDQNPTYLDSIAWIVDALGVNNGVVTALKSRDVVTTHSYQFTADIAAVGPYGRGYRRVKFIFDVSEGSPKILYRQDLSRLGWALGTKARETLVAKDTK